MDKLLDVLDEYIKDSQIFVRIHCFNQWIVVRIKADMEQECCFEKKIKDVFCGDLVNIISDEEYQIIKFCYSECAKGEEKTLVVCRILYGKRLLFEKCTKRLR